LAGVLVFSFKGSGCWGKVFNGVSGSDAANLSPSLIVRCVTSFPLALMSDKSLAGFIFLFVGVHSENKPSVAAAALRRGLDEVTIWLGVS